MKRIAKCLIAGAMMALAAACSAPKSEIDKKVDELMKQDRKSTRLNSSHVT